MVEIDNIYVILMTFLFNVLNLHQIKHEEMLQFARSAIAGLKVSADVARLVFFSSIHDFLHFIYL